MTHDSQVRPVSYSTGENGSRLKWLSCRPVASASGADQVQKSDCSAESDGVRRAQYQDHTRATRSASADPLDDPFGDAGQGDAGRLSIDENKSSGRGESFSRDRRLAGLAGPNARGPRLRPIAASRDAMPLSGLSGDTDSDDILQDTRKLLLSEPSEDESRRKVPSVEEELAANPQRFMDACPPKGSFKAISELSDDITAKKGKFPRQCDLHPEDFKPRTWTPTTFAWTAPGMCHKPLYFEQIQVERYGHSWGPLLQPLISGAHFFVTVPILPYKMGVYPPGECMYSLGYYRPGNCAPYMLDPLPLSVRGGLIQAGAVVGAAYVIP